MTDITVQKPTLVGAAPVYTAVTAADRFQAVANGKYLVHYKNGATPTGAGAFKIVDQVSAANAPAAATLAGGWADAVIQSAGMAATTELVDFIDNASRFRDSTGWVNLTHTGTITTVSVAVFGPF